MVILVNKCPKCGSTEIAKLRPPKGYTNIFLPEYELTKNVVDITNGIAVETYGCVSCKDMFYKDPRLNKD